MARTAREPDVARPLRRDAALNQERVLAAAVSAMLRDGRNVPMSVIATDAGVGVGTLYRKYPNREALLDALTLRAFELLVTLAGQVPAHGSTGLSQLDWYWDQVIAERDQLVLPLHGGPMTLSDESRAAQRRLHAGLRAMLRTGLQDGSIRAGITLHDLIYFGAMLAWPIPGGTDWRRVATRQKQIHLDGLAGPAATVRGR